jgi:hypothetical protein
MGSKTVSEDVASWGKRQVGSFLTSYRFLMSKSDEVFVLKSPIAGPSGGGIDSKARGVARVIPYLGATNKKLRQMDGRRRHRFLV